MIKRQQKKGLFSLAPVDGAIRMMLEDCTIVYGKAIRGSRRHHERKLDADVKVGTAAEAERVSVEKDYDISIGWRGNCRYLADGFRGLAGGGIYHHDVYYIPDASQAIADHWRRVGANMRSATKKVKGGRGEPRPKDTRPGRWLNSAS